MDRMVMEQKTYLHSTSFQLLENWSVQYLLESKFSYNDDFDLVPIGTFLIKSRLRTHIEDDRAYQRVTVKINNNGVISRDLEIGKNIGTKQQYIVKAGQFLMSKIDARNGAFGLVPENLEGAIVTNDFPVFDIDNLVINPEFLVLITTTKEFIKFAQSCSSGTTNRQRIDIGMFLNVKIPLPSLPEQNRIVKSYNARIKQAEEKEAKAKELEESLEKFIYSELGIKKNKVSDKKVKGLQFTNFEKLSRWDINFLFQNESREKSKYPLISYNELFISLINGIPSRNYSKSGVRFLKVADIKNNLIDNSNIKYIDKYRKSELIEKDTLLITRKGTVGNSFYVKEDKKYTASSEIFIIKLNDYVSGDFLAEINLIEFVKKQYREKNTGTIMPSLSQDKLKEILIPLPPKEKQQEIVSHITKIKTMIEESKTISIQLKQRAIQEFENEIFQSCD
jgi:restriction endonuclease S subunit